MSRALLPAGPLGAGPRPTAPATPAVQVAQAADADACAAVRGCITCSGEAIPMRVLERDSVGQFALCEDGAGRRAEVLTGLIETVAPGDVLLVHAGAALARVPPREGSAG
jgi:hydrogenase maturation factor